jgi:stress-induced morphogen
MSNRSQRIIQALQSLQPIELNLADDSHKHASHIEHLGEQAGQGETHFHLTLVSEKFEGVSRIDRQRMVNDLLSDEFKNGLHALQMKLHSRVEFTKRGLI